MNRSSHEKRCLASLCMERSEASDSESSLITSSSIARSAGSAKQRRLAARALADCLLSAVQEEPAVEHVGVREVSAPPGALQLISSARNVRQHLREEQQQCREQPEQQQQPEHERQLQLRP